MAEKDLIDRHIDLRRRIKRLEDQIEGRDSTLQARSEHPDPIAEHLCMHSSMPTTDYPAGQVAYQLAALEQAETDEHIHRGFRNIRERLRINPPLIYQTSSYGGFVRTVPGWPENHLRQGPRPGELMFTRFGDWIYTWVLPRPSVETPAGDLSQYFYPQFNRGGPGSELAGNGLMPSMDSAMYWVAKPDKSYMYPEYPSGSIHDSLVDGHPILALTKNTSGVPTTHGVNRGPGYYYLRDDHGIWRFAYGTDAFGFGGIGDLARSDVANLLPGWTSGVPGDKHWNPNVNHDLWMLAMTTNNPPDEIMNWDESPTLARTPDIFTGVTLSVPNDAPPPSPDQFGGGPAGGDWVFVVFGDFGYYEPSVGTYGQRAWVSEYDLHAVGPPIRFGEAQQRYWPHKERMFIGPYDGPPVDVPTDQSDPRLFHPGNGEAPPPFTRATFAEVSANWPNSFFLPRGDGFPIEYPSWREGPFHAMDMLLDWYEAALDKVTPGAWMDDLREVHHDYPTHPDVTYMPEGSLLYGPTYDGYAYYPDKRTKSWQFGHIPWLDPETADVPGYNGNFIGHHFKIARGQNLERITDDQQWSNIGTSNVQYTVRNGVVHLRGWYSATLTGIPVAIRPGVTEWMTVKGANGSVYVTSVDSAGNINMPSAIGNFSLDGTFYHLT